MSDSAILAALRRMGLVGAHEVPKLTPLTGGVSSNILRADLVRGPVCVKQALAKLKVEQDWFAPVSRNFAERDWLKLAARIAPDNVPAILGEDDEAGLFAMAYLDPAQHPVWKMELREGRIDLAVAEGVAAAIAAIHGATAGMPDVARAFANDETFDAIRLDPYLKATARKHPELAPILNGLSERTAQTKRALVHGDVSPKNILVGPKAPILLDAECAWYGDPAFDAAFCLNHLLLKAVWCPQHHAGYDHCFRTFAVTYLGAAKWEERAALEARIASLLPGLMLARIDGKSPVEYITGEVERDMVRRFAIANLVAPPATLAKLADDWMKEFSA